jgi:IS5 family transposase
MNVHAGVDKYTGLVHSEVASAVNELDLTPAAQLLQGDEEFVYADTG